MAATERIQKQRPPATPNSQTQSSSVPSTPHQQPSDIRFPSRSPSPNRGLSRVPTLPSNGLRGTNRVDPGNTGVCRFESGAEFRKRRIPYKDGGNELLPPPTDEPKQALSAQEEEALSSQMQALYDRLLPTDESEDRRARIIRKLERILNEEWPDNDIKVNVFGSSGNLLSSSDSDVDICITTTLKDLESMHSLALVLHRHGLERIVCRAAAKVPIVKAWDPELQLACDLNVNNTLALENTRMIKTYVLIDERVRPLAKIIKYWTKQRFLNDAAFGGTISSYTWICMIINFLQSREPRILPSLQQEHESLRLSHNGGVSSFADDIDKLAGLGKENKETLGSLLFGFFRFYGYEMDYTTSVVSVKEGRVLSREEKGWAPSNYQDKEARVRLCVEEPFNPSRNLGNSADDYAFSGIHEEIRRAFDLIAAGKLEECCEEYVFPVEEKPLFQRPAPRPKPTLTRSASQSGQHGRSHANSVGAKGGGTARSSRASSSHRANSRRASSGATFGNQRYGLMSPSFPVGSGEYLGSVRALPNEHLHEQLYQQYQLLQAQQELLRSQLIQQQQSHMQAQVQAQGQIPVHPQGIRTAEYAASSPRQRAFAPSLTSTNAIPLLPGYLYHYPSRLPRATAPMEQRLHDGAFTTPPSPSTATMTPTQRRSPQRGGAQDGSAPASTRSQSQPGRSFPSPVALQSMAYPGFDVSGAVSTQYLNHSQLYQLQHQRNSYDTLTSGVWRVPHGLETAMPKEYVGYSLGQSPQMIPQRPPGVPQMPLLPGYAAQHRQPSPEVLPPILPNGSMRTISRSPPGAGRRRSHSLTAPNPSHSAPLPQVPFLDFSMAQESSNAPGVAKPPAIANGSGIDVVLPSDRGKKCPAVDVAHAQSEAHRKQPEISSPVISPLTPAQSAVELPVAANTIDEKKSTVEASMLSDSDDAIKQNGAQHGEDSSQSESVMSPNGTTPNGGRARPSELSLGAAQTSKYEEGDNTLSAKSDSETKNMGGLPSSPSHNAPLLSPVAELQTPSPASLRDKGSPSKAGVAAVDASTTRAAAIATIAAKNSQLANGKLTERVSPANGMPSAWANPPAILTTAVPLRSSPSNTQMNGKPSSTKPMNGKPPSKTSMNGKPPGTDAPRQAHPLPPRPPSPLVDLQEQLGRFQRKTAAATAARFPPSPMIEWQKMSRKTAKKGKAVNPATAMEGTAGEKSTKSGEPVPAQESERKGG